MKMSVMAWAVLAGVLLGVMGAFVVWLPLYENWQTSEAELAESEAELAALPLRAVKQAAETTPSAVYHTVLQSLLVGAQADGVTVNAVEAPAATDSPLGTHVTGEAGLPSFEAWLRHSKQWGFKRLTLTSLNNGRVAFQFYAEAGILQPKAPHADVSFINPFCQQLSLPEARIAAAMPISQRVSWRSLNFAGNAKRDGKRFGLLKLPTGALIAVQAGDVIGLELVPVLQVTTHAVTVRDEQNQEKVIGVADA